MKSDPVNEVKNFIAAVRLKRGAVQWMFSVGMNLKFVVHLN